MRIFKGNGNVIFTFTGLSEFLFLATKKVSIPKHLPCLSFPSLKDEGIYSKGSCKEKIETECESAL